MRSLISTMVIIIVLSISLSAQNNESKTIVDPFINPPESVPVIFAEGIISVADRYEYGLAISPQYDEIFFTASTPGDGLMVMRKQDNGNWTLPAIANLRGNNSWEQEAFYTTDGQKLFFASDVDDTTQLWYSVKKDNNWSKAVLLDSPVNNTRVFWATFTNDNTMYYSNLADFKIYSSKPEGNKYKKTQKADIPFGLHPSISKDESFILFDAKGDIYVSTKDNDGGWSEPVKLGELVSTPEYSETCPSLSPDEKYIFFSRYNDIDEKSDIYWVSAEIIKNLSSK